MAMMSSAMAAGLLKAMLQQLPHSGSQTQEIRSERVQPAMKQLLAGTGELQIQAIFRLPIHLAVLCNQRTHIFYPLFAIASLP